MFQKFKSLDEAEVESALCPIAAELGISESALSAELEGGQTVKSVICTICVRLLSEAAEEERVSLQTAQREGIRRAKENGQVFGRPQRAFPKGFSRFYERYKAGTMSSTEAARLLKMTSSTFRNMVARYETKQSEK